MRIVQMVRIKLFADVNKRKCVLTENGQFITRQLRDGEDWRDAIPCAIADRIGAKGTQKRNVFFEF